MTRKPNIIKVGDLFTVRIRESAHSKFLDCSDAVGTPGFKGRTFIATAVEGVMICAGEIYNNQFEYQFKRREYYFIKVEYPSVEDKTCG